jgi:uncharacterized protein YndB with AHSA1/START domain
MADILHRVGINKSADRVFQALTTIEGLRGWWTNETKGDPREGAVIDFGFCKMRVEEARPSRSVLWKCIDGPADWLDTEVSFQMRHDDHQTFVLFKHAGWRDPTEFMHHCSTKWGTFLLSLRDWVESGEGTPAPYDVKIHVGD